MKRLYAYLCAVAKSLGLTPDIIENNRQFLEQPGNALKIEGGYVLMRYPDFEKLYNSATPEVRKSFGELKS